MDFLTIGHGKADGTRCKMHKVSCQQDMQLPVSLRLGPEYEPYAEEAKHCQPH